MCAFLSHSYTEVASLAFINNRCQRATRLVLIERIDKPLRQHRLIMNILHIMKQACLQGRQREETQEELRGDRQINEEFL